MGVLVYFLFFGVVCAGVKSQNNEYINPLDGRIVGGSNVNITQFPYQVFLRLFQGNNEFQCGGSIISTRYILTAAHCLDGIDSVSARVGSTLAGSGGQVYNSSLLFKHPLYDTNTVDYDIGLVRLTQKITLDGVTSTTIKIAARGASIPAGTDVVVSGWGRTSEDGPTSNTLMAVTVPTISNQNCSTDYAPDNITITSRMFCAGLPQGGKDSCSGDSGAPTVQTSDGIQIGVVSFGVGCARPNKPGVYTRIANTMIRLWIRMISGV